MVPLFDRQVAIHMAEHLPELEKNIVSPGTAVRALTGDELLALGALFERLFPTDESGPGALDIGVLEYTQRALTGTYVQLVPVYRSGLAAVDQVARANYGRGFADLAPEQQDAIIQQLENDNVRGAEGFFGIVWQHLREGLFSDPIHGGNKGMAGWRLIGFPGAQFGYSANEQRLDVVVQREPRSIIQLQAQRDEGTED
jgi:hypothetical protein